ncbi:MAG: HPr family phosphocarrier protein [Candidatus Omnitrophota bacterium]
MMVLERDILVKNKTGLHARPAALFVQKANKYESDIKILKDGQEVNGKSIMGILMLAAEKGARIKIVISGNDAEEAMEELSSMLSGEMDEEELGRSMNSGIKEEK